MAKKEQDLEAPEVGEVEIPEEQPERSLRDEIEANLGGEAPEVPEVAEAPPEAEPPEAPEPSRLKPPIGWSPTVKEQWAQLAPEVQEAIANREREVDRVLQDTAQSRKVGERFTDLCNRYQSIIAAENVTDPLQGIEGLMQITAQLQMGTPQLKAQRIAGLINYYGVDIELLDRLLAGQQPDPQTSQFEALLNQRLAPVDQLLARLNQSQYQASQQMEQTIHQDIEAFGADPAHEFFAEVRLDMADFLDLAAQRGLKMSLQEAYDRACAMNPDIAAVLSKRRADEASRSVQNKRTAASSVSGRRGGGSDTRALGDMSLRESLEAQLYDSDRV